MRSKVALCLGIVLAAAAVAALVSCGGRPVAAKVEDAAGEGQEQTMIEKIEKTDREWKEILTADQYRITRRKGTERAFSSPLNDVKEEGVFRCVCCGLDLFSTEAKFDSGTGWPSFRQPAASEHVVTAVDRSLFRTRTEVLCARCDAHLGHVFADGPEPTGLRYCINGMALEFVAAGGAEGR